MISINKQLSYFPTSTILMIILSRKRSRTLLKSTSAVAAVDF